MHDLTAERAALLVHQRLVLAPTREAKEDNLKVITAALKTARQEALREGMTLAAEEADMHVCDDPRFCHCSSRIYKAIIDRLAREGG